MMSDGGEISAIDAWFANAKGGNVQEINELLKLKAVPVNSADHLGNTALHYAATAGHDDVVSALIKGGADVNVANKVGDTALHKAAGRNRLAVVKVLVAAKANVDLKNKDDERAIDVTKDQDIKTELSPVIEGLDDDDDDDDVDNDKDYNSDEEPDDE